MKKNIYFLFLLFLASCGSTETISSNNQRTIQKLVVAVKSEGNSTVISSGRLDNWYRVNTPLTEGMIYEMTMEVSRVVTDPVIISANVQDFSPVEFLQRDLFGRYITKYKELRAAEGE